MNQAGPCHGLYPQALAQFLNLIDPSGALLLFDKEEYRSWWFETGTPTFLIKQWQAKPRSLPDLDNLTAGDELVGSFDIENLKTETLLFQAGYLTVKTKKASGCSSSR